MSPRNRPRVRLWDLPVEMREFNLLRGACVWDYGSQSVVQSYKDLEEEVQVCFSHRLSMALQYPRLEDMRREVNRSLGDGVSEFKCAKARGYYTIINFLGKESICLLKVGTEKNTQTRDIQHAKKLAEEVREWLNTNENMEDENDDEANEEEG